ncbi:MAG: squalene--hopene cyclase [Rhodospirillales bacterium]
MFDTPSTAGTPDPADPAQGLLGRVDRTVDEARAWLLENQRDDGHWAFEFEADATIPAEYVMLNHFLDEPNERLERKIGNYLREIQGAHGGWPLFHEGDFDISASVKAYYALKLIGDSPDAPHMARAREAILRFGGAERANVFTRILLALFQQVPWRAVPVMRVEACLLPKWAPFHMDKVSYWTRTVMTPLLVLYSFKPKAKNPKGVDIRELFTQPPETIKDYMRNPTGHWMGSVFLGIDKVARAIEPLIPKRLEEKAMGRAVTFIKERLNGTDGLGGIFPAITFALIAFDALGYSRDDPAFVSQRKAIEDLLIEEDERAYCQPCLSPVWDTGLALHALLEAGVGPDDPAVIKAFDWLKDREITDVKGDWAQQRPGLAPGGWAFQYRNPHYPDVDDTAVVGMAFHRADPAAHAETLERTRAWVEGMQSENGGWGAFDADNTHYHLNHIPFADHGAMLDPPTVDVSARCLGMMAQMGYERDHPAMRRAVDYLKREQEPDGSWYGRWGTNYIYGTWSALSALNAAGEDMSQPWIRKAVDYLTSFQREDGGWGEDCATYWEHRQGEAKESTPSHTSWAVLALMAAGEAESDAARRGVEYLVNAPREASGKWVEHFHNAPGFPRVFYLKYHGYSAYFPLWTLARYGALQRSNSKFPHHGI